MPDLSEALDRLLTARYSPKGIRSAITTARGLNARLNALQGQFPTRKAMAAALGVSPETLRRWRSGAQKPKGPAQRRIEGAYVRRVQLPAARRRLEQKPPPNSVTVTAVIVWNGYTNRIAHRSTTLGNMRGVMYNVIHAWTTAGPHRAAEAFLAGVEQTEGVPVHFEGDDVHVSIPWEN